MTSIGSQDAAAAAEAQRHSEAQRAAETQRVGEAQRLNHAQATHKGMRFATLHRGTNYAYGGNLEHARQIRLMNTRNLQRLAWLRSVMQRSRQGELAGGVPESGGSEGSVLHPREAAVARRQDSQGGQGRHAQHEGGGCSQSQRKKLHVKATSASLRKTRRSHDGGGHGGGGGAGGGDSGQQRRERQPDDGHDAHKPGAATEMTKPPAAPLAVIADRFDAASNDPRHSDSMRSTWGHGLLDIVDWLASDPSASFHLGMIQQVRRWLALKRRDGAQPAAGLGPFVELTKQRAATSSGPRQGQEADAPRAWGERVRDARFLAPLIWLNGDRPSTNVSLDQSIARIGMQEAVIGLHAMRTLRAEQQADAPHAALAMSGPGP